MAIRKQEFYEGAALHLLARTGNLRSLSYTPPFFTVNNDLLALLKYSTRGRSPWGFTFTADEQSALDERARSSKVVIGLVCGSDGVVAIGYDSYKSIALTAGSAIHISCYRSHGEHYEVNGPDGKLARKVSPSSWQKII